MSTLTQEAPGSHHLPANSPFGLFDFVRGGGEEGRAWVDSQRTPQLMLAVRLAVDSVGVLRQKRVDEGRAMLDRARLEMAVLAGATDAAMQALLDRWLYGALGYYFYCLGQQQEADEAMVRAHEAVVAAVSHKRFLAPLAASCSEFHLNRARVARGCGDWARMHEHIGIGVAMGMGRMPFCTLHDGTELWLADLREIIRASPAVPSTDWGYLALLLDDGENEAFFDRTVRGLYRLGGFALQYP